MHTFTRQGEPGPARSHRESGVTPHGRRREEYYATPFGVGRLTLRGDLPLELDLPDADRVVPDAARRRPRGVWVEKLEAYFAA